MRPVAGQGAGGGEQGKEFLELGIPEEWIEPLFALGLDSIEKLKNIEKPGKLHLPGLSPENVTGWIEDYKSLRLLRF